MRTQRKATLGRRQVLGGLAVGGAVTAAAALGTRVMADTETNDEKRKSRYKETEHVKSYYRVNRYPA